MNHKMIPQIVSLTLAVPLLVACGAAQPAPASTPISGEPSGDQVTLYYEENAQFELISPQGTRVLIDVFNPSALSSPVTEKDVLLTTHGHGDHITGDFADSFPGQQLRIQAGEINLPDVSIRGIASAHSASGEFKPEGGSNYIFIVDMGGLRIAHFGDIGQDQLTQEQLDALGEVDVALTQFVNSYSQMSVANKKGFNLMAQVKPRLIIPTHGNGDADAIKYAMELWEVFAADAIRVSVGRSNLTDGTQVLVMGEMAHLIKKIYDLPAW
jgi:L-ascorbate metabolism protein UlaG (beta-lactamase superfamily)